VGQIKERLQDRFRLLTGGMRTTVARQRTLEATVEWSYDLLSKTERRLLCRLSVFAGGWTLEAAENVCSGDGIKKEAMLDLLSRLVDKSLVIAEEDATATQRYRFLETVRQYARERLLRSGQVQRLRNLHFDFFVELARHAELELTATDQVRWLNRLDVEHDNLRAALEWSWARPEYGAEGLELAVALFWFWMKRGYFGEGRQSLERAMALNDKASSRLRAKALVALEHMTFFLGDYPVPSFWTTSCWRSAGSPTICGLPRSASL
jgi:predicted ATPase